MGAFTYNEWEALWLLTIGQVEFSSGHSPVNVREQDLVAMAGGEDISARFHRLKNRGYVTIHRPGWLNGEPKGWRIEITNEGWAAMDHRPSRASARYEGDGEVSDG